MTRNNESGWLAEVRLDVKQFCGFQWRICQREGVKSTVKDSVNKRYCAKFGADLQVASLFAVAERRKWIKDVVGLSNFLNDVPTNGMLLSLKITVLVQRASLNISYVTWLPPSLRF